MKEGLGGQRMTEFVRLGTKTYSYLINGGSEDKKQKTHTYVSKKT